VKKEEHLRRPAADAAHRGERGDDGIVVHAGKPLKRKAPVNDARARSFT